MQRLLSALAFLLVRMRLMSVILSFHRFDGLFFGCLFCFCTCFRGFGICRSQLSCGLWPAGGFGVWGHQARVISFLARPSTIRGTSLLALRNSRKRGFPFLSRCMMTLPASSAWLSLPFSFKIRVRTSASSSYLILQAKTVTPHGIVCYDGKNSLSFSRR